MRVSRRKLWLSSTALAVLLALVWPVSQAWEAPWRDWRIRQRAASRSLPPSGVVLVATDAQALREIKAPLSLWLPVRTRAVQQCVKAGARVVALDSLEQFDPQSILELGSEFQPVADRLGQEELTLALLTRDAPVVLGAHLEGQTLNLPRDGLLAMAGDRVALLNLQEEADGVVRRAWLHTNVQGQNWPFLSSRVAALAGAPMPPGEDVWIDFRGPGGSFPRVSLADVIQGKNLEGLKDKVVLLGSYDPRLQDLRRSPFSPDGTPDMFGVEVHAQAVDTLLRGSRLQAAGPVAELGSRTVLAVLASTAVCVLAPGWATLSLFGLAGAAILLSRSLFSEHGVWLGISDKLGTLFTVGVVAWVLRGILVERSRAALRRVFSRYAPPQLVDQLMRQPDMANLGGGKFEVTLLFSDINGFSTLSEKVTPEVLIGLVNDYFREMTAVIHAHGGLIRQFVGDEIMVIFGAPVARADHAAAAVTTAIACQRRLDELAKANPGKLGFYSVKVGLHSGQVVCGNVGSEERTEYTAVGDDVNLASRVMGLNKALKTDMLVTRQTVEQVPAGLWKSLGVELRECGSHPVKGRAGEVELCEIVLG
jgi:adenylate cyclase